MGARRGALLFHGRLDQLRRNWLNPEEITQAEPKKRTLTNLYNQRPMWLQNAHAALDGPCSPPSS